jgi:hypothetical protein
MMTDAQWKLLHIMTALVLVGGYFVFVKRFNIVLLLLIVIGLYGILLPLTLVALTASVPTAIIVIVAMSVRDIRRGRVPLALEEDMGETPAAEPDAAPVAAAGTQDARTL